MGLGTCQASSVGDTYFYSSHQGYKVKIIEAMKTVKLNLKKCEDLRRQIQNSAANLSIETPLYGADTAAKITGWLQTIHDIGQDNITLLVNIQRTNLVTQVPITINGITVTKSIAEWVWRRRAYADQDRAAWAALSDRGLKEEVKMPTGNGQAVEVKLVRFYDPTIRDQMIGMYRDEPFLIDSALEVVNATTELVTS